MIVLEGKRIVVTRPRNQAQAFIERIQSLGGVPIAFPTIAITPQVENKALDRAIEHIEDYEWLIFTSQNGVEVFWESFQRVGDGSLDRLNGRKIAAIGPATAAALSERGAPAQLVPPEFIAESIVESIGDVRGQRILLPRAEAARPVLVDELTSRGAEVDEITLYRTLLGEPDPRAWQELRQGIDVITFTSSSTVHNFFELTGPEATTILDGAVIACIGPITAGTVEQHGYSAQIVADEYTTEGLVEALVKYYEQIFREG